MRQEATTVDQFGNFERIGPVRLQLLQEAGIEVERVQHEVPLNDYNTQEMVMKKEKLQHLLTLGGHRFL